MRIASLRIAGGRLPAVLCLVLLPAAMAGGAAPATDAPPLARLAAGGKALLPVVVGPEAGPRVRAAAENLAEYLGRIGGATFRVQEGDGAAGIVVGVPADFQRLPAKPDFPGGRFGREDYLIRSARDGVWLLGATELAVEHAVWDLLYRLGHRQFFPGDTWEIVPKLARIELALDVRESPDFYARRIWYNWGMGWGYNREPYARWCARNRHARGFMLNSGHAYGAVLAANRAAFDANPGYYALVDGRREHRGGDTKFCIANPGLRKLVVEHAVRQVRARPELDSISMDPSDGNLWCECDACARMGSVSDRVVTLANEVAAAVNDLGLGEKYVGMYAYNRHSPPPAVDVHPKVIVSSTTAFLRGGLTQEQIIDGWQARGATMGIYDYFSVIAWDWNLPGRARAARPATLAESIRAFHRKGARFYDAESGDAWGPYGLGFYIAARTMWDTDEADRVEALLDDFLAKAFGPAEAPMREFYRLLHFDPARRSAADLTGRMYRALADARKLAAGRPEVLARIDQLILYTRYVELYNALAHATGDAKAAARDRVVAYAYRIRETMMVHAYGFWARTVGQKAAHEAEHPLQDDRPFTEAEILAILRDGIAANEPVELAFEPVEFSEDLVPADPLKLPEVAHGSFPTVPQDRQTYWIWVEQAPAEVALEVTVEKVWALRPHRIALFSPKDVAIGTVAESDVVRPDGRTYGVALPTPYDGLHRLDVFDGGDHTRIAWPEGMRVTLPSGLDAPGAGSHFRGPWTLYFYVPKGTKVVGGWAARIAQWAPRISGVLRDGDGRVRLDFASLEDGWFTAPVPDGQDGRLWRFEKTQGLRQLATVPPYLARSEKELLLPREVVERDAPH